MQGGYVPRQEIVQMLGPASVELFNHFRGKPSQLVNGRKAPGISYQVSTQVDRALNPFLQTREYGPSRAAGVTGLSPNGTFTAPANMVHPTAFDTGSAYPPDVLDDGQKVYGLNDKAFGPTADFPKIEVLPAGKYRVHPAPKALTLTYLALPPTPVYHEAEDLLTGELVYDDAASVDVGWGRQHEPELIERTLRLLAQAVRDGQLSQTAAALTQENS